METQVLLIINVSSEDLSTWYPNITSVKYVGSGYINEEYDLGTPRSYFVELINNGPVIGKLYVNYTLNGKSHTVLIPIKAKSNDTYHIYIYGESGKAIVETDAGGKVDATKNNDDGCLVWFIIIVGLIWFLSKQ